MKTVALMIGVLVTVAGWGYVLLTTLGKIAFLGYGLTLGLVGAIGLVVISVIEIRNASLTRPRRKH